MYILYNAHSKVYIPKSNIFRALKPVQIDSVETTETPWTKITNSKINTMEHLKEILHCLLPATMPQSHFQPKTSHCVQTICDTRRFLSPQEAQDKLSLLL